MSFLTFSSLNLTTYNHQHKGCLFKMLLCNKLPTCPLYKLIFLPKILFCQNHTCIRISKTASHELYFCHNCSWKKYTCHVLDKSEFSQMFSPLRFHLFFSKGCLLKLILSATLSTCPMCRSVLYPKILFCKNCSWKNIHALFLT